MRRLAAAIFLVLAFCQVAEARDWDVIICVKTDAGLQCREEQHVEVYLPIVAR